MTLYATEQGELITTHSMIKTFRRCPKQAQYKYMDRLKPKSVSLPLKQGDWMHKLLEAHYKGEDWQEVHRRLTLKFNELFDEEKEEYGNLPDECYRMMRSYLWHYQNDPWIVHEVELVLECEFPDGSIYRGRIDLLIENQFGLWIVDHKNNKTLPKNNLRILDAQSALYIVAAVKMGIPVQGFIWNYLRRKAPTKPELIKDGSRVARWNTIDTDYPTAARFFKKHPEIPLGPYKQKLRRLRDQQYVPGQTQSSTFFRRDVLEKDSAMLKRVWTEAYHTHKRLHSYFPQANPDAVERVPERSCDFMCSYSDICQAELMTGDASRLRRQNFRVGDPHDYYYDDKQPNKGGDD